MQVEVHDEIMQGWLQGQVKDVRGDSAVVAFTSDGTTEEVPWDKIRLSPPNDVLFQPVMGGLVEALSRVEDRGMAWFAAEIKQMNDGKFISVHYLDYDETYDEVVERSRIRPTSDVKSLGKCLLVKKVLPLPHDLVSVSTDASVHDFLLEQSGLVSVTMNSELSGLILLGTSDAISKAELLEDVHYKRLSEQKRLNDFKGQAAHKIEELEAIEHSGSTVTFTVDESLMGLAIGKNGANIKSAQAVRGILRVEVISGTRNTFQIIGRDAAAVEKSRELLEFCEVVMPIQQGIVRHLVGVGGRNIHDITTKSGIARIDVTRSANDMNDVDFVIVGRKENCEKAKLLLTAHIAMINEREKMDTERSDIVEKLRSLGLHAAKEYTGGRGRSSGGRGNGRGSNSSGRGGGSGGDSSSGSTSANNGRGSGTSGHDGGGSSGGRGRAGDQRRPVDSGPSVPPSSARARQPGNSGGHSGATSGERTTASDAPSSANSRQGGKNGSQRVRSNDGQSATSVDPRGRNGRQSVASAGPGLTTASSQRGSTAVRAPPRMLTEQDVRVEVRHVGGSHQRSVTVSHTPRILSVDASGTAHRNRNTDHRHVGAPGGVGVIGDGAGGRPRGGGARPRGEPGRAGDSTTMRGEATPNATAGGTQGGATRGNRSYGVRGAQRNAAPEAGGNPRGPDGAAAPQGETDGGSDRTPTHKRYSAQRKQNQRSEQPAANADVGDADAANPPPRDSTRQGTATQRRPGRNYAKPRITENGSVAVTPAEKKHQKDSARGSNGENPDVGGAAPRGKSSGKLRAPQQLRVKAAATNDGGDTAGGNVVPPGGASPGDGSADGAGSTGGVAPNTSAGGSVDAANDGDSGGGENRGGEPQGGRGRGGTVRERRPSRQRRQARLTTQRTRPPHQNASAAEVKAVPSSQAGNATDAEAKPSNMKDGVTDETHQKNTSRAEKANPSKKSIATEDKAEASAKHDSVTDKKGKPSNKKTNTTEDKPKSPEKNESVANKNTKPSQDNTTEENAQSAKKTNESATEVKATPTKNNENAALAAAAPPTDVDVSAAPTKDMKPKETSAANDVIQPSITSTVDAKNSMEVQAANAPQQVTGPAATAEENRAIAPPTSTAKTSPPTDTTSSDISTVQSGSTNKAPTAGVGNTQSKDMDASDGTGNQSGQKAKAKQPASNDATAIASDPAAPGSATGALVQYAVESKENKNVEGVPATAAPSASGVTAEGGPSS